jgi:hypothetical protein
MFMSIYNQITTREFNAAFFKVFNETQWSTWDEFRELWKDREFRESCNIIGQYYEGLEVLVREEYLSIRLVALLICGQTRVFWERFMPTIRDARKAFGFSRFLSESEYLYIELMKYLEKHPELMTEGPGARAQ